MILPWKAFQYKSVLLNIYANKQCSMCYKNRFFYEFSFLVTSFQYLWIIGMKRRKLWIFPCGDLAGGSAECHSLQQLPKWLRKKVWTYLQKFFHLTVYRTLKVDLYAYITRKFLIPFLDMWRKPWFEKIHAPQCSSQHYLQ